jgi:hypothetical protein
LHTVKNLLSFRVNLLFIFMEQVKMGAACSSVKLVSTRLHGVTSPSQKGVLICHRHENLRVNVIQFGRQLLKVSFCSSLLIDFFGSLIASSASCCRIKFHVRVCVFSLTEEDELPVKAAITRYATRLRFIRQNMKLACI